MNTLRLLISRLLLIGTCLLLLLGPGGCAPPGDRVPTTRVPERWTFKVDAPCTVASHGMVATVAPLATHVGAEILKSGGNAMDASVATAFALAVVYPGAGNIGGGGFIVARFANGTDVALDFREKAPRAASREMYLDEHGEPTNRSITGHLASGVPGSVAGLWEAHRKYGTKPWQSLIEPAIRLAADGFVIDRHFAESVQEDSSRLVQFPASAALFLPDGRPLQEGMTWHNPDLAATLRRIAQNGPAEFYRGKTADLIVSEMKRGGGILSRDDLVDYQAAWREPIRFDYRGFHIISMPPPSSGGITLALIANILEGYDLHALGWHSADALHLAAEAMRRAFVDRNQLLGDPDVVEIPTATLLSKDYAASRRATISSSRATPSEKITAGSTGEGSMHTTHFSIVDAMDNAVAMTTTINLGFGSAVTVTGGGFLLNDEMDDFAAKPGSPNAFGLIQGEANTIAPGKRILSSMTPTIVVGKDGNTLLVTGASGGPRIISAVFQVLSNVADFGFDVSAAVSAPRIHHQHLPDLLLYEPDGYSLEILSALQSRGHVTMETPNLGITATILRREGVWHGMADPRGGGNAEGY